MARTGWSFEELELAPSTHSAFACELHLLSDAVVLLGEILERTRHRNDTDHAALRRDIYALQNVNMVPVIHYLNDGIFIAIVPEPIQALISRAKDMGVI